MSGLIDHEIWLLSVGQHDADAVWDFPARPPSREAVVGRCGLVSNPPAVMPPWLAGWQAESVRQLDLYRPPLQQWVTDELNRAFAAGAAYATERAASMHKRPRR